MEQVKKLKNLEYLGFGRASEHGTTGTAKTMRLLNDDKDEDMIAVISDKNIFKSWSELKVLDLVDVILDDTNTIKELKKLEWLNINMSYPDAFINTKNKSLSFDIRGIKDMPNLIAFEDGYYNIDTSYIKQMKNLKYLYYRVYPFDNSELEEALPNCLIYP